MFFCFPPLLQIITKTGELPRPPTTHPEETEEELTEQQDTLGLAMGRGPFVVDGSTEGEGTQDGLEEEEEEEEEVEEEEEEKGAEEERCCLQVKDESGENRLEEEQEVEELGVTYRQVRPSFIYFNSVLFHLYSVSPLVSQGSINGSAAPYFILSTTL